MDDLTSTRKRQRGNFLVPPPPPDTPSMLASSSVERPFMQAESPQIDPSGIPSAPVAPNLPNRLEIPKPTVTSDSPAFMDLADQAKKSQLAADDLHNQLTNYAGESDLTIPQSPFEQAMANSVQGRMAKLLTEENSTGEKFGRGFDVGQKLASNLLVPLLGSVTKNAGKAMGSADAMDTLKAQSMEADRQRLATRATRNQLLAQMSTMWDSMSPQSSKNLLALAKLNIDTHHKNLEQKNALQRNLLSALDGASRDKGAYLKALEGLDETGRTSAIKQFDADLALAREQNSESGRNFNQEAKRKELKNADVKLNLEKNADQRAGQEFEFKKSDAGVKNDIAKKQFEFQAGKEVLGRVAALQKELGETQGILGRSKYGNLLDRVMNNPAYIEETNQMMKRAGMSGDAKSMLQSLKVQQDAMTPKQQAEFDLGGYLGNSVGSLLGGNKEALPTKSQALPPKIADAHNVIADFAAQNGRMPTPEELVKLKNGGK